MLKSAPGFLYKIPIYPLLLAFYPVVYLWLVNVSNVPPSAILVPLLLSLALTAAACSLAWLVLRNIRKAAAVAGLFLVLFFVYGHFFDLVQRLEILGSAVDRQRNLLLVWVAIFVVFSAGLIRSRSSLYNLTWISNLVAGFLTALTVGQLAYAVLDSPLVVLPTPRPVSASAPVPTLRAGLAAPDVYYILLDGYDREDLLNQDIGVSNRDFIAQLEQLGFVVPGCTQSNYNTTSLSVAGTLNMNYLDALGFSYADLARAKYGVEMSTPELEASIQANPVMDQFKAMGYKVITFHETYPFINFPNSDIVYDYIKDSQGKVEEARFQYLFWKTTGLEFIIQEATNGSLGEFKNLPDWLQRAVSDQYNLSHKYQNDLYQLDRLDHITAVPGRKFVYAHLMVTHPEFAFKLNGEIRDNSLESKAAYGDQVGYVDQRILAIVKHILATSQTPPIIILQGDHGYGYPTRGVEQFKILNAYYLPQGGSSIYPSITPVNTFRLILSRYFNEAYPLLPDQSIWIDSEFPEGYRLEPGTCE